MNRLLDPRRGRRAILLQAGVALMTISAPGGATDDTPSLVEQRVKQVQSYRAQVPTMPREASRGYPVPFVFEGRPFLAVPFFLRKGRPPDPPEITAPGWVVYIDVATGTQLSSRTLTLDPTVTLGRHAIDPPLDMPGFIAAEQRLYALMTELLPMLANPGAGVPDALLERAIVFARLWRQLSQKPLAAHYRALNPAWFDALKI